MKYYFYIDETEDPSLTSINADFPYFLLCGVLVSETANNSLGTAVSRFKQSYFGTDAVILHSRDIRKYNPPFQILFDLEVKKRFYSDLNSIMASTDMLVISVAIQKEEHLKKYWPMLAKNPYILSLSYLLERMIFFLEGIRGSTVEILAEKRWKKEDAILLQYYNRIITYGTWYCSRERLERIRRFEFRDKRQNDFGIQIADLCAYPIVSYARNPDIPNPAFDIIRPKIYQSSRGKMYGLKIFP